MIAWRISNHNDLTGLGGERCDGRWHTAARGKRIVYLAEHPAVVLVETLVNLRGNSGLFPERFQLLRVALPERYEDSGLDGPTVSLHDTRAIGDAWLAAGTSAVLRVPSVPSPESWNYLLNPAHHEAADAHVEWTRPLAYDRRLFRLKEK